MRSWGLIKLKRIPLYFEHTENFVKYFQWLLINQSSNVIRVRKPNEVFDPNSVNQYSNIVHMIDKVFSSRIHPPGKSLEEHHLDTEFQRDCVIEAVLFLNNEDNKEPLKKMLLWLGERTQPIAEKTQKELQEPNEFILSNLIKELCSILWIKESSMYG